MDARDNRKCLQGIKNIKLSLWEEGLLKIRPIRRKGCQLNLSENFSQNILHPYSPKTSEEILTAEYIPYFYEKFTGAYASQTDFLNL